MTLALFQYELPYLGKFNRYSLSLQTSACCIVGAGVVQSSNISDRTAIGQPPLVSFQRSSPTTNRQPSQHENVSRAKPENQIFNSAYVEIGRQVTTNSLLIAGNRHSIAGPSDSSKYRPTLISIPAESSKSATSRTSESTASHLLNQPTRNIPVRTGKEAIKNRLPVGKIVIYPQFAVQY